MHFRPPHRDLNEHLLYAKPIGEGPFRAPTRARGARKAGLVYEKWFKERMREKHGGNFKPGQWFAYRVSGERERFCQIDGLLFHPSRNQIIICESKLRHTADAYFQLVQLYLPVVRRVYGSGFEYPLLEVCKWFDPDIAFPAPVKLNGDELNLDPSAFSVKIWSHERERKGI